jgi:hypothetical protein
MAPEIRPGRHHAHAVKPGEAKRPNREERRRGQRRKRGQGVHVYVWVCEDPNCAHGYLA